MDPLALAASKGYPSLAHKVLAGQALQGRLDPQALLHSFKDLVEIRGLVESRGPKEKKASRGRMDRMAKMAPRGTTALATQALLVQLALLARIQLSQVRQGNLDQLGAREPQALLALLDHKDPKGLQELL
jgi:hypothetical protein